jgi:hypothetical protein
LKRCKALFQADWAGFTVEHICVLPTEHGGEHAGHATSRDLVAPEAERFTIPFVGRCAVWQEQGWWLAYVHPPADVMAQGISRDEAIERVCRSARMTALLERRDDT